MQAVAARITGENFMLKMVVLLCVLKYGIDGQVNRACVEMVRFELANVAILVPRVPR